jgi:hypothetical protein
MNDLWRKLWKSILMEWSQSQISSRQRWARITLQWHIDTKSLYELIKVSYLLYAFNQNHFFFITLSVSKVRSSQFCLYLLQTVFFPLFWPNFQQSNTISSRSPSKCGLSTYLLGEYCLLSSYNFDFRKDAWSSSLGTCICRLLSAAPIFCSILLILISGNFSYGPFLFPRSFLSLKISSLLWF